MNRSELFKLLASGFYLGYSKTQQKVLLYNPVHEIETPIEDQVIENLVANKWIYVIQENPQRIYALTESAKQVFET